MLRVWNVSLVCGTFALALLGTFLVRSGILQSIHAFGASTVGAPLLVLIAIVVLGSAALIVSRLDDLRSEKRIESLASREAPSKSRCSGRLVRNAPVLGFPASRLRYPDNVAIVLGHLRKMGRERFRCNVTVPASVPTHFASPAPPC